MALTLSVDELLADILVALKKQTPALSVFSTDFSSQTAKLNDIIKARVNKLATAQDYGATGYENGATDVKTLLEDVPVTLNQHKHVPVKIAYLDSIKSKIDLYDKTIGEIGFVLGKAVVDYALSKVLDANFSQSQTFSVANSDKDFLESARIALNSKGASPMGRFALVNSAVSGTLGADPRLASKEFSAQNVDTAYMLLKNVSGFENVIEYPDLPANGENLSAFFGASQAICIAARLPDDPNELAGKLGIPSIANTYTVTDPDTGLSLLGIAWQKTGTFDVYVTVALIFGVHAGSAGGADGAITDYYGLRNITV